MSWKGGTMHRYLRLIFILILAASVILVGGALAQRLGASTEPGEEVKVELTPSYISGDPAYADILPPDDNPPEGINVPARQYSYYLVSGATLRGRSSITEYTYAGSGCTYTTIGTDTQRILNSELNLPQNSTIKYLRLYYNDSNPNSGVDGFLTRYKPGQLATDLTAAGSPDAFAGGFGFVVSPEITETVINSDYAYTLIGFPDENNIANQICGLRVAYYPPYYGIVYLPSIHR
jgi:hypothetical protein